MRIAWASPIGERSAIGRVSADVCRGLVEAGHAVTVIATEMTDEAGRPHPVPAPIVSWREAAREDLPSAFDLLAVNFGDHYGYHGGLFRLLDRLPTIGIFHDFFLFNLFMGWAADPDLHAGATATDVAPAVARAYGDHDAAELVNAALRGEAGVDELVERLPMTDWAARRCQGALAHADFYLERLANACPGPVMKGRMPVSGRGVTPLSRTADPVTCLTVGVMNPNKCADQVIRAFGRSPLLQARARYRLAGPIDPSEAERLTALAQTCNCSLTILGAVSDAALQAELEGADIICCLRKPVLEGCSGSAIEALLAGRPTVVADAGFYAELPEAFVTKVDAGLSLAPLVAALEALVGDGERRVRSGREARAWAEETFALEPYVRTLETLMAETAKAAPLLDVGREVGVELDRLGVSPGDPAVTRIGALLEAAFGDAPPARV